MKKNILPVFIIAMMLLIPGFVVADRESAPGQNRGMIYLNGDVVRTQGVPANLPHGGSDPLFVVSNGVSGQLGIAGLGPGEQGFSGGDWAFYDVTFNAGVTPYLLDSDEAVHMAEMVGDITVTRVASNDFRCPVLP
jgi:hypothetical protein